MDALRDDYLANIGDAARLTADAIVALGDGRPARWRTPERARRPRAGTPRAGPGARRGSRRPRGLDWRRPRPPSTTRCHPRDGDHAREPRGSASTWRAWLVAAVVFMVVSDEQLEAARAVAGHLPSSPTVVNPYTGVAAPLEEMTTVRRPVGFVPTPRAIGAARATLRRSLELVRRGPSGAGGRPGRGHDRAGRDRLGEEGRRAGGDHAGRRLRLRAAHAGRDRDGRWSGRSPPRTGRSWPPGS